jgi:hypothetical protein
MHIAVHPINPVFHYSINPTFQFKYYKALFFIPLKITFV